MISYFVIQRVPLQVFWPQSRILTNLSQRGRSKLFAIVKTKSKVRPTGALQFTM
jgi:hypothetical protein